MFFISFVFNQSCCMQHLCRPAWPHNGITTICVERKMKHNKGSGDQRSDMWKETKTQHRFSGTLVLQRLVAMQNSDCCFGCCSHFALTFPAWCVKA